MGDQLVEHPGAALIPQRAVTKEKILAFQRMLEAFAVEHPGESFGRDDNVANVFAPGLYARALFIPAGTVLVGAAHRTEHLCLMLYGRMSVATEAGPIEVEGPWVTMTKPGIKRVGYAFTDSLWMTFHPTAETNLDTVLDAVTMPEAEYEALAGEEAAAIRRLQGKDQCHS